MPKPDLTRVLARAFREEPLEDREILYLLQLEDKEDLDRLFATARSLRERYFGRRVFLYGFIYFSTWCRNDCAFCYYRASNKTPHRYRKPLEEVLETASQLAAAGVHLVDLTMGEDPFYYQKGPGLVRLRELVQGVKRKTGLSLMVSPGAVSKNALAALVEEGVDWFACYQETHNRRLYRRLRLNQGYDSRMQKKVFARTLGFLIEEGIMVGLGESDADILHSLREMERLGAQQVRVMSFVPQEGTPLERAAAPSPLRGLKTIAVMRLLFPRRLIPASLDVAGLMGLRSRLGAGANVVTSIIPPQAGLLGVSNSTLDVDNGGRNPQAVRAELARMGLEPASLREYQEWVEKAKTSSAGAAGGFGQR